MRGTSQGTRHPIELFLHELFAPWQVRGEWYEVPQGIIECMTMQSGVPISELGPFVSRDDMLRLAWDYSWMSAEYTARDDMDDMESMTPTDCSSQWIEVSSLGLVYRFSASRLRNSTWPCAEALLHVSVPLE